MNEKLIALIRARKVLQRKLHFLELRLAAGAISHSNFVQVHRNISEQLANNRKLALKLLREARASRVTEVSNVSGTRP